MVCDTCELYVMYQSYTPGFPPYLKAPPVQADHGRTGQGDAQVGRPR
jgi:hypothetical protein